MPDYAPTTWSKNSVSPAPTRSEARPKAPVPASQEFVAPTSVPNALSPSLRETILAPQPAQRSNDNSAKPVAPVPGARAEVTIAPAPVVRPENPITLGARTPDNLEAPAPRLKPALEGVVPLPYQNLLYFETLTEVVKAVKRAKARVKVSGDKFAWSRVSSEPEIQLTSFEDLTKAVFGSRPDFNADALLDREIDRLPTQLAVSAKDQRSSLQLEGLWIEFSMEGDLKPETRLRIAVSIAIADTDANTGPFPANRVYLTFGDSLP